MTTNVTVGYNENDQQAFTTPVSIDRDTRPGQMVPIPVCGPAFSMKMTNSTTKPWELRSMTLYFRSLRVTS